MPAILVVSDPERDVHARRVFRGGLKMAKLIVEEDLRLQNVEDVLFLDTPGSRFLVFQGNSCSGNARGKGGIPALTLPRMFERLKTRMR